MHADAIMAALREVMDPELPVSIVDLGIVRGVRVEAGQVTVRLRPTFVGCPATVIIQERTVERVQALVPEGTAVAVEWERASDWGPDAISQAGRCHLQEYGISVEALSATAEPLACPYCGSHNVQRETPFGPTLCRAIAYCPDCRNPFEYVKVLTSPLMTQTGQGE